MDFVLGADIEQHCARHALGALPLLQVFERTCAAVDDLHRAGFVHLDLKPANILVEEDGAIRLIDFGASEPIGQAERDLCPQVRFLTPAFASPEQLEQGVISVQSDVFSLGAVLYCLLGGGHPFVARRRSEITPDLVLQHCRNGDSRPLSALLGAREYRQILRATSTGDRHGRAFDQPPRLREFKGSLDELDRIAHRAVCADPKRRYGNAEELTSELQELIAHLS
jgi:eukaryotic-like serine/threonine-protein kinase